MVSPKVTEVRFAETEKGFEDSLDFKFTASLGLLEMKMLLSRHTLLKNLNSNSRTIRILDQQVHSQLFLEKLFPKLVGKVGYGLTILQSSESTDSIAF